MSEEMSTFSFGIAIDLLKKGGSNKFTRKGWNGKGMYVSLAEGDGDAKLPFLFLKTTDGKLVPWAASQTDLLADDWYVSPVGMA